MSVGHVARLLEESGIPTVVIAVASFRRRMEIMSLPRVLLTPHMMGRPLGYPGDHKRQREVLLAALDLFNTAEKPKTIVELD
ncbi:hypothetical protein QUF76_04725 [Desulfobacterales bacterium HSG16]|nr:hypothetical protein [Desulfobacterales bacterium HSG16]